MREVQLPSGATLKVSPAPFVDAKNLYQALLRELRDLPLTNMENTEDLYKNLFCIGFSSPHIEAYLSKCLARCTYNDGRGSGDRKIDGDTFEPVDCRQDYMKVCVEVAQDNVAPFMSSLLPEFSRTSQIVEKHLRSQSSTTSS